MERTAIAHREAARHVAAYLLRPSEARPLLSLPSDPAGGREDGGKHGPIAADTDGLTRREARAVDALARALLERGTLASEEADLIVDVARGEATPDDLRHYRSVTRQSRCGFE